MAIPEGERRPGRLEQAWTNFSSGRWPMRLTIGGVALINTAVSGVMIRNEILVEGFNWASVAPVGLGTTVTAFFLFSVGYYWRQFEKTENTFDRIRASFRRQL